MKKMKSNRIYFTLFIMLMAGGLAAQDSATAESIIKLRYFSNDNKIPYLLVKTQLKLGKKYTPVTNVPVKVYIDSDSSEATAIGKIITGKNGEASVILPEAARDIWVASAMHNFIALSTATKEFGEVKAELPITKSKIIIDTSSDEKIKNITVTVTELKNNEWVAAKDVEVKIGIARLGSVLAVGDEETYTTDSTGTAVAEFKKDSLPGDEKGNIMLVAKVEDNEQYGNLIVEKKVAWGVNKKLPDNFNARTLWATRDKAPGWLLFMAYSIIIGVWGTLLYLVWQLIKIKKLGKTAEL